MRLKLVDKFAPWDDKCVFCESVKIVITAVSHANIDTIYCADCENHFLVGYYCSKCGNLEEMGGCKNKCDSVSIARVLYI